MAIGEIRKCQKIKPNRQKENTILSKEMTKASKNYLIFPPNRIIYICNSKYSKNVTKCVPQRTSEIVPTIIIIIIEIFTKSSKNSQNGVWIAREGEGTRPERMSTIIFNDLKKD